LRICYIADARSIHTQRWVDYFAKKKGHQVHIIISWLGEGYTEGVCAASLIVLTITAALEGIRVYQFTTLGSTSPKAVQPNKARYC